MANGEIIRSICLFTDKPNEQSARQVERLAARAKTADFEVQTTRLVAPPEVIDGSRDFEKKVPEKTIYLGRGAIPLDEAVNSFVDISTAKRVSLHADLTKETITADHTKMLFKLMDKRPDMMFNFAYGFNLPPSSPFFPSAKYEQDGYAVGLQSTSLAARTTSVDQWLGKMSTTWEKVMDTFGDDPDFLGIDGSIAPLMKGSSSLMHHIKRWSKDPKTAFDRSVTTDLYLQMTNHLKEKNPKPVGLNGLMLPAAEDFELAKEYDAGRFPIERNVFLSMHSGLGIDTYPIGMNEDPERVADTMRLVQGLSNKHQKPLAIRFVSDGKANIGEKTDFKNEMLKDVYVKPL